MKQPSLKQMQALHNISIGMSKRQAMIKAGYSVSTANQATRVMKTESMRDAVETLHDKLVQVGITPDFIADKMSEWLNASKTVAGQETPDYDIQLKAYGAFMDIMKHEGKTTETKTPKRQITLTEWLNQDT